MASAIARITPGGTIYLRGGFYKLSKTVTIPPDNNGVLGARKQLSAYPGETPVLSFSAMSEDPANRGLAVNGSFWHVYGLVVDRAGDNGIFVGGSNNVIERTVTRFNRDSGLQISRVAADTPRDRWPSNNLVLSVESHDNADSGGENADGFAAKLTVGPGNVFRYAVSHHNVDDGWDLYTKPETGPIGPVTIEDSLAFNNGTLSNGAQHANGDRNGYKLGGSNIKVDHVIRRSIAYRNGKHGFTYNSNPGSVKVPDNISIDNGGRNYAFDVGSHVFRDNTSCRRSSSSSSSGGGGELYDKTIGDVGNSNQFWSGANGSRCSSLSGALKWSFAADGRLVVTIGGVPVKSPSPSATPPATSTPAPTPTSSVPSDGLLLADDFEDGNSNGWTATGGSWKVRSNGSRVLTQSALLGSAVALSGSSSWAGQSVEVAVRPTRFDGSGEYVAVLARAKDASNYYMFVLREANRVEIHRVVKGKSKVLGKASLKVDVGTRYTLRLEAQGGTLRGFVDGELLVNATDSTFASGKIGLGTYDTMADFDDVVVSGL